MWSHKNKPSFDSECSKLHGTHNAKSTTEYPTAIPPTVKRDVTMQEMERYPSETQVLIERHFLVHLEYQE